jgi:hypothetical protein
VNPKSARTRFVAALALYILWIGALVALAIVSADRPPDARIRSAPSAGRKTDTNQASGGRAIQLRPDRERRCTSP